MWSFAERILERRRSGPNLDRVGKDREFLRNESHFVLVVDEQKVFPVKDHFLKRYLERVAPRVGRYVGPIQSVHQRKKSNFLALVSQLLRHLQSNCSSHAVATEEIGSFRLASPDFFDIAGGHLLNAGQKGAFSV